MISEIRKDYKKGFLDIKNVESDPINQFSFWMDEVFESGIDEPNAMILATSGRNMQPSARIVILRDFSKEGFVFYTNYTSNKGNHIDENPKVALTFFWKELERQVRVEGDISRLPEALSQKYFDARPFASRLSAVVSPQSKAIPNREYLESMREDLRKKYPDERVPMPREWGGYIVKPKSIEFWQGRAGRLHDRILYTLKDKNIWKPVRLAP